MFQLLEIVHEMNLNLLL